MPLRTPDQRAEVLRKIDEKLSANTYLLSFEQAFETLKEIEAEMLAAEDDSALYSALFKVREELKRLMDGRALELGKSEDWAEGCEVARHKADAASSFPCGRGTENRRRPKTTRRPPF